MRNDYWVVKDLCEKGYSKITHNKENGGPSMVVYSCNPSYSGGGDWKDCSSRPNPGKKLKTYLNQ
jgi:hypothetical protein